MHVDSVVAPTLCCNPAQNRVVDYFHTQWEQHKLLLGENSLAFTNALSGPLQKEITLFMVCA